MNRYKTASMEKLFLMYEHENNRCDQKDKKVTQSNIVKEVYRRTKKVFDILDNVETEHDTKVLYEQFINGKL